jgi:hypothetical protein
VIYIDTIAYVASQSMAPEIIHEYNISGILEHPLRILVRGLVLQEEPLNLDLLQLMIPLMAFFPFALWGLLRRPNLTLAASVALYVAARWFDWNFRVYPDQEWTFNPFCWQMLMVLGGWFAVTGASGRALHGLSWLRVLACATRRRLPPTYRTSCSTTSRRPTRKTSHPIAWSTSSRSLSSRHISSRPIIPACNGDRYGRSSDAARNGSRCSASAYSCP